MRSAGMSIETKTDLVEGIDSYAETLDGRLGIFLGFPEGADDFEVVYQMNAEKEFTSASVIKLPILYALYEKYDEQLADLETSREIAQINQVGGSGLFHLLSEPTPSLEDLARAMISISDNTATNELIDEIGIDQVELAAARVGMHNTRLRRKLMATLGDNDLSPSGEWPEGEPANVTTPGDCARFFADIIHESTLSSDAYNRLRVPLHEQKYTSLFTRYLPFEAPIAHKTGSLPTAALDTGYISSTGADDTPLVFAVFATEVENHGDGSDIVAKIGDMVYEWLPQNAD